MLSTIKKSYEILHSNNQKLPKFVFYFCILAVVDLLGIGMLGPYISIAMDQSKLADRF